jgi:hypothetical protein
MTDENLERHLRDLPAPELPEHWRADILAMARQAARDSSEDRQVWPALLVQLRNLFARNPVTSGALTALWLLIFLFHATTPVDPSSRMLIAKFDPNRPVYLATVPEEIRLALFDQDDEEPATKLRP